MIFHIMKVMADPPLVVFCDGFGRSTATRCMKPGMALELEFYDKARRGRNFRPRVSKRHPAYLLK
jgi:hypothetical protein